MITEESKLKKITMFLVVAVIVLLSFFIVNNYESAEEREKSESHFGSIVCKFWERIVLKRTETFVKCYDRKRLRIS